MAVYPVQARFGARICNYDPFGFADAAPWPLPIPVPTGPPGSVPVAIGSCASAFVQAVDAWDVPAPVLAAHDPAVGQFVHDHPVPERVVGVIDEYEYLEPETPDGRFGMFVIGVSPIGWRRPYHGEIIIGVPPGSAEGEIDVGVSFAAWDLFSWDDGSVWL